MVNVKALLSKLLASTEHKTLLWTNPNPTSAFAGQTITVEMNYDAYEIVFTGFTGQADIKKIERLDEDMGILTFITGSAGQVGGVLYVFKRQIWKGQNGIGFGEVYSAYPSANWARYTANTGIVPYKIFGIKLVGGVVKKLLFALIPKRGWAAC